MKDQMGGKSNGKIALCKRKLPVTDDFQDGEDTRETRVSLTSSGSTTRKRLRQRKHHFCDYAIRLTSVENCNITKMMPISSRRRVEEEEAVTCREQEACVCDVGLGVWHAQCIHEHQGHSSSFNEGW